MKNILTLTICLLFSCAYAQGSGFRSEGREFYLGYIHPSFNDFADTGVTKFFKVYALVSSFEDNEVAVSYFDELTKREGYPTIYQVKARQTVYIPLDHKVMRMKNPGDVAGELKSCHFVARRPVSVQYFSTGANAGGSYLALPVQSWGRSYTVASYKDEGNDYPPDFSAGCFLIIAAYDGTNVTIIPTAKTGGGHIGVNQGIGASGQPRPYTVGLKRGQTWLVKSYSASIFGDDDISASIVKADKPVAVIAGHEAANVGTPTLSGSITDPRDYMIEQMIPHEFWHRTGNIVIPMVDNPAPSDYQGDVARVYVSDKLVPPQIKIDWFGNSQTQTTGSYLSPIEKIQERATDFHADTGKFMVVQYDQRSLGAVGANTSPNMVSIVPKAHWRTAYQFSVPTIDTRGPLQSYFITILASKDSVLLYHPGRDTVLKRNWMSDSIRVSIDGKTQSNLSGLGTTWKQWINIPGHPDVQAVTYRVVSGSSYYFSSPIPFMVYQYGNRSLDFNDTTEFSDEHYFSYALPAGMSLSDYTVTRRLSITVDTLCSGWRICATDSNAGGGIRYVTLIDDEDRDLWPDKARKFSNIRIDPSLDVYGYGEFHSTRNDLCFSVEAVDPSKPAYAPLAIYDQAGNYTIIELSLPAHMVTINTDLDTGLVFNSSIMQEHCKEFTFVNLPSNSQAYTVTSFALSASSHFSVSAVTPPIGAPTNPGDTLRFSVCFTGPDSLLYRDNLQITTNCLTIRIPLTGQASPAQVLASDKHFGTILFNSKRCGDVEVKNVGIHEFILRDVLLPIGSDFTFDPQHSKNRFPIVIPPGGSHKFWVCYAPKEEGTDTAKLTWITDIPAPFHESIKTFSILTGKGTKPGVQWDREKQFFRADSTQKTIERIYLTNTGNIDAELVGIYITGVDASEFSVVATQFPPTVIPPGDTIWVDVTFTLDMTRQPIDRIHRALLQTAAKLDPTNIKTVDLEAGFGLADVAASEIAKSIMIRPNPARDRVSVDVNLQRSELVSMKLFDVLGREIRGASYSDMAPGWNTITVDLHGIPKGTYIAVIRLGDHVETRSLIIE